MRHFAQKGFRIEQLSIDAKIIYTGFLVFSVAGLLVSVLLYGALVDSAPIDGGIRKRLGLQRVDVDEHGLQAEATQQKDHERQFGPWAATLAPETLLRWVHSIAFQAWSSIVDP